MSYPALNPYRHSRLVERAALAVAAAVLLAIALPVHAEDNTYVVKTTAGKVRGVARAKGGAEFLGIPYAEPPVGRLRWRAPVAKKKWSGIHDANAFGASCTQPDLGDWNRHDAETGQEDCLYINVIAPAWPAKGPLPVMMWIHGGANLGGSGSGSFYTDGTLLDRGVLIVTINYRLDVLGYFAHPELAHESSHRASGNYGLLDQILALRWVHSNIARFGGDPNNVTVFGQSAGSMNIGMLIASPLARGLFEKAIGESGSPLYPAPMPRDQAEKASEDFAAEFSIPAGSDPIKFLRNVPARDLIAKASKIQWGNAPRGPNVDGYVLPNSPAEIFQSGQEAPIPLLLGVTSREFGNASASDLTKEIEDATGKFAPRALALYRLADGGQGSSDPVYGSVGIQWEADYDFHCPVTTEALWHSAAHNPTYLYEFDHPIPGQEAQGALHSSELPYVFGNFPTSGNIGGNFGPADFKLADLIQTYWTNFAKTGDPNSENRPSWPGIDGSQRYMIFTQDGLGVLSSGPLRGPQCDLYREVLAQQMEKKQ
ncbi:MAG: carboxylesterase/lipase family protein [Terracidiphilus sp.]